MPGNELHILPDNANLLQSAAEFLRDRIAKVLSEKAFCTVALSGGSTPRGLYERLGSSPYLEDISWWKLRFFLGDEQEKMLFVNHFRKDYLGETKPQKQVSRPVSTGNFEFMEDTKKKKKKDEAADQFGNADPAAVS